MEHWWCNQRIVILIWTHLVLLTGSFTFITFKLFQFAGPKTNYSGKRSSYIYIYQYLVDSRQVQGALRADRLWSDVGGRDLQDCRCQEVWHLQHDVHEGRNWRMYYKNLLLSPMIKDYTKAYWGTYVPCIKVNMHGLLAHRLCYYSCKFFQRYILCKILW